jgi:hypothetical protein
LFGDFMASIVVFSLDAVDQPGVYPTPFLAVHFTRLFASKR